MPRAKKTPELKIADQDAAIKEWLIMRGWGDHDQKNPKNFVVNFFALMRGIKALFDKVEDLSARVEELPYDLRGEFDNLSERLRDLERLQDGENDE